MPYARRFSPAGLLVAAGSIVNAADSQYPLAHRRRFRPRADPHEWANLAGDPHYADVLHEHARWLPSHDAPPVPGSAVRLLTRENGVWFWEGKPIVASEKEP